MSSKSYVLGMDPINTKGGHFTLNEAAQLADQRVWPFVKGTAYAGSNAGSSGIGVAGTIIPLIDETPRQWRVINRGFTPRHVGVIGGIIKGNSSYALVINDDGDLLSYGSAPSAVSLGSTTSMKWSQVEIGTNGGWLIRENGNLYAFGTSIGSGATLLAVDTANSYIDASCGYEYGLAVRSDGTLWAKGSNTNGKTGLGTTSGTTSTLTQVNQDTNWLKVSCGTGTGTHSAGIKSDGTLWMWGSNLSGRTGLGTTSGTTNVPTKVGTATNWVDVCLGSTFSIALNSLGEAWGFGGNSNGAYGYSGGSSYSTPVKINNDTDWVACTAGFEASILTKSNGDRYYSGVIGEAPAPHIPDTARLVFWKNLPLTYKVYMTSAGMAVYG